MCFKLAPLTKVSLDQCLLGQKSSWTIVPWTKVFLDNCPLDKCSNTLLSLSLSLYCCCGNYYGHPKSPGWSPTNPGWSPNYSKDGNPLSSGLSPTISRTVTVLVFAVILSLQSSRWWGGVGWMVKSHNHIKPK